MQISNLSGYQTAIFLALIAGRGYGYDDEALALIEKHSAMIAGHKRRKFQPQAVALIITAKEATDAIVHEPTQPFTAADRAAQPTDLTTDEAYTRQAILDVIDAGRRHLYTGERARNSTADPGHVTEAEANEARLKFADAVIVRLREMYDKLRKGLGMEGIVCPTCQQSFPSYPDFTAHIGSPMCGNEAAESGDEPTLTSPTHLDAALASLREKLKGIGSNVVIEEVEPGSTAMKERDLIDQLCRATGLNYCDEDCDCGDNAGLMFWPVGGDVPAWLPDWTNGADYMEIYRWLQTESLTDARIRDAVAESGLPLQAETGAQANAR